MLLKADFGFVYRTRTKLKKNNEKELKSKAAESKDPVGILVREGGPEQGLNYF